MTRLAFDREGERLVSTIASPAAERSGDVMTHLIKTGEALFQETALAADVSPAGLLATAELNGTMSLREVAHAEQKVTVLPGHIGGRATRQIQPDGSHLRRVAMTARCGFASATRALPSAFTAGTADPVLTFDISLDGRRIVSGDVRGVAKCWNTNVDDETLVTKVVEGPTDTSRLWPVGVSFSRDGQQLAIAMRHGRLHVVDAAIGKELWSEQRSGTFSFAYQPHRDLLLALRDNALVMRKASTGEIFEVATEANGFGSRVAFSRDGESFAAATKEGVGVFEAATGKLVRTLVCDGEPWLTDAGI